MMLVKLTKTFPVRVTEWLVAGIMLSWSIVCWNLTPEAWALPTMEGLGRLASQNTWAFFAFWIAVVRLAALAINGAWRPSPHIRGACAFLSCFMWLQISLGMLSADLTSLGMAVYPWLLLADIYNVFRASLDARASDERARMASVAGKSGECSSPALSPSH